MEGYLKKYDSGRYGINDEIELTCGDLVEVKTGDTWTRMRMEHDGTDYLLMTEGLSFYPRRVYIRLPS